MSFSRVVDGNQKGLEQARKHFKFGKLGRWGETTQEDWDFMRTKKHGFLKEIKCFNKLVMTCVKWEARIAKEVELQREDETRVRDNDSEVCRKLLQGGETGGKSESLWSTFKGAIHFREEKKMMI